MTRARRSGPRKVRYYKGKRRAIMAAGEDIVHLTVFERDNWICGICNKEVDRLLRQPDPQCATLDHIVPISVCLEEGWPIETIHTYANVQCSHNSCNLKKGSIFESDCVTLEEM